MKAVFKVTLEFLQLVFFLGEISLKLAAELDLIEVLLHVRPEKSRVITKLSLQLIHLLEQTVVAGGRIVKYTGQESMEFSHGMGDLFQLVGLGFAVTEVLADE